MTWKRSLVSALLGSAVLLGGMTVLSLPAQADPCGKVREERRELNRAIARHGYWSSQAERERRDLRIAEERCGGFQGGWRDRDDRGRWRGRGDGDHDRDDRGRRHHDRDRDRDRGRDRDRDRDRDRWHR